MKPTLYRILLAISISSSLGACGSSQLSTRATNPVIEDAVVHFNPLGLGFSGEHEYSVLSTTGGRRSIFVRYRRDGVEPFVCAEAPPDAIDAYANSLSLSAQGSAPSGPSAGLSFAQAFGVNSGLGLHRSQGLQYLRDQSFALCMMLLQDRISPRDWQRMHDEAAARAERLIAQEIPGINAAAAKSPIIVTAPMVTTTAPPGATVTSSAGTATTPAQPK